MRPIYRYATITAAIAILMVAWIGLVSSPYSGTYDNGPVAFDNAQTPDIGWLGANPDIPASVMPLVREANEVSVFADDPGPETIVGAVRRDGDAFVMNSAASDFAVSMQPTKSGDDRIQVALGPSQKLLVVLTCSVTACVRQGATVLKKACAWTLGSRCASVSLTGGSITLVLTADGPPSRFTVDDLHALIDMAMGHGFPPMPVPVDS